MDRVVEAVRGLPGLNAMADRPTLSLVLACYNEAEHLRESFAEILDVLLNLGRPFEVLFVDDVQPRRHPRDPRRDRGRATRASTSRLILHDQNQGRGATVTDGFRAARGEITGFLDVDLEVHARYIPSLVRAIEKGADVATVRRIYAFQLGSLDRYVMSRGYSWLVRRLLGVPLRDTETGYKFFRRERLLPVLDAIARPGLVLGHRVHGARAPARPPHRGGPRGLRAPGRQDLDRAGAAGLGPLLRDSSSPSAAPAAARGSEGAARDRLGAGALALRPSSPWPSFPTASPSSPRCAAPTCALLGARIGARSLLHDVRFFNLYRRGPGRPRIGDECFLGDECLLDLAEGIELEDQVTLAERVLVLTHLNVGYADHPLQSAFPAHGGARCASRGAASWAPTSPSWPG